MKRLADLAAREPVLLVGAVVAWVAALSPPELVMGAVVSTGAYIARMLSRSKRSADEDVEIARYVGALEGTGSPAPPAPPEP